MRMVLKASRTRRNNFLKDEISVKFEQTIRIFLPSRWPKSEREGRQCLTQSHLSSALTNRRYVYFNPRPFSVRQHKYFFLYCDVKVAFYLSFAGLELL